MIYIYNNAINKFVVPTNNPSYTGTTSGYTLSLTNELSNASITGITLTDTSAFKTNYHYFTLTCSGNTNLTGSTIHIQNEGHFYYHIYATDSVNSCVINEGILYISGDSNTNFYTNDDNENNSYFVYENN